eukprot:gene16831-23045_t
MGNCCSGDVIPPIPPIIKPDPDVNQPVTAVIATLGYFGFSRDYGVWQNTYPSTNDDRQKEIWLWLNKSSVGNMGVIELENFSRGHKEDDKQKGRVLFKATFIDKLIYTYFHRYANQGFDTFFGFINDGSYQDYNDDYYTNNCNHTEGVFIPPQIISKWQLSTSANIVDGDLGRGSDTFRKDPILLEVYSKGTVITTYRRCEREVHEENDRIRIEHYIQKFETKYVDRIEYRISFRGQLWTQFAVKGNTDYSSGDTSINCPLFNTVVDGGFFTRSKFITNTLPGIDPALAILISHLCATEYSVANVLNDLDVNLPSQPPMSLLMFQPSMNFQPTQLNGVYSVGNHQHHQQQQPQMMGNNFPPPPMGGMPPM